MFNWGKQNKKIIFAFLAIGAFLLTAGLSCSFTGGGGEILASKISLELWTVFESPADFDPIIKLWNGQFPNIEVKVRKFRVEDYEQELINALAEDRGPDIFMLHNTMLKKHLSKLEPLPPEVTLPKVVTKGSFKKDVVVTRETIPSLTALDVKQRFVDVVAEDVIIDDKIYGLPLYIDTLALYYNRDLLNSAGFAQPPQFWEQFQSMSAQLTKIGVDDALIQSGAALGTTNNIENATDILALLMMQTGAKMTNVGKTGATFHLQTQEGSTKRNPGMEALRFYTDFARTPPTTAFSWSENEPNNLEAFSNGKLAFFFGYSYHLPLIKARTLGKLNFSIAPMVQIGNSNPVNIANYWMPLVSKKSEHIDASWAFIEFITAPSRVNTFLSKVKKPTAIRELIEKERSNEDLFAFAGQALTAKNWYYGKDIAVAKRAFEMMVKTALTVESDKDRDQQLQKAVNDAAAVINQTYK